jgi:hypothetical protein
MISHSAKIILEHPLYLRTARRQRYDWLGDAILLRLLIKSFQRGW